MAGLPNVRLDLLNKPENVLLVRETLTGVADATGLQGAELGDIRTAVTEACNNVVLHAYAGGEGPLEVEVVLADGSIEVLVRDHGVGIARGADIDAAEPGLGVPVIEALSDAVAFDELTEGPGTAVRMSFSAPSAQALEPAVPNGNGHALGVLPDFDGRRASGTAAISVAPRVLARSVIPRLLCVLAARAHFSTDRISDSQLVGDALVAHARTRSDEDYLHMAINVEPRDLELRVGPLPAGGAERLVLDSDVRGLGRVLEKLADHHTVGEGDSAETLTLQLLDPSRRP
ncbi:MAG TPA: ATP-binding protein [Solirubrobacteraceae bacterium]|nr:ATP-binding protein [Solirubrobacteraceae bacterium]